jgi:hypothetical protein
MKWLVVLAVAALPVAACGNDDDGGDGGTATEAQCQQWQDDFDDAALGHDLTSGRNQPAAEDFTDRMTAADDKMRDGGCYE